MGGKTRGSFTSETAKKAAALSHTPEAEERRAETKSVNALLTGEVYSSLREILLDKEKNDSPYYQRFLKKFAKEGLRKPNSPAGMFLAAKILPDEILQALDSDTEKYMSKDIDFFRYRLQGRLFEKQKYVFNDNTSRKIVEMCSRRAGKTENNADLLLKYACESNTPVLYVNLTFENAVSQIFQIILDEAKRVDLMVARSSKSEGLISFANGSTIKLKGNKDKSEADKLQGFKYKCVIIDEAQSQCNMNYLIDTIINPMLMDFEGSVLILTGTPPRRKGTYFEMAFNNPSWTKYHWTMKDNPFIKNVDEEITRVCDEKGVTPDSPFIQREYFGQIAYDTEAQVFKGYKVYKGAVPSNFVPTHIYEGVDFGYADYNGIVTMAANVEQRQAYIIYERKFNKATVSDIINSVREGFENGKRFLLERNPNADLSNCQIFTDTNEKSITYELSQTYGLPAYCAYKYDKALAIEQLAEECRTGRILNIEGGEVVNEFEQTLYKRDDLDNITSELDDGYHPDITIALLYASRQYFYDCGLEAGGESKNKQTGEF